MPVNPPTSIETRFMPEEIVSRFLDAARALKAYIIEFSPQTIFSSIVIHGRVMTVNLRDPDLEPKIQVYRGGADEALQGHFYPDEILSTEEPCQTLTVKKWQVFTINSGVHELLREIWQQMNSRTNHRHYVFPEDINPNNLACFLNFFLKHQHQLTSRNNFARLFYQNQINVLFDSNAPLIPNIFPTILNTIDTESPYIPKETDVNAIIQQYQAYLANNTNSANRQAFQAQWKSVEQCAEKTHCKFHYFLDAFNLVAANIDRLFIQSALNVAVYKSLSRFMQNKFKLAPHQIDLIITLVNFCYLTMTEGVSLPAALLVNCFALFAGKMSNYRDLMPILMATLNTMLTVTSPRTLFSTLISGSASLLFSITGAWVTNAAVEFIHPSESKNRKTHAK